MSPLAHKLLPFLARRHRVRPDSLRADALAGIVSGLVVLPQGVAYATLAGLPPQYGLYCAMVPVMVAALWGSSWHQISGPTNALSLVVFATVAPLAAPGSGEYVTLVLTLCLLMGATQLAMGLARLGALVNFISHTVIVGFTAGAALLIIASQLRHFFGVPIDAGGSFFHTLRLFVMALPKLDVAIASTGLVTLGAALVSRRLLPRVPYMIVAMVAGGVYGYLLTLTTGRAIPVVGPLSSSLPPLSLPSFDPDVWRTLAPAALALTVLGLTEAVSIARAIGTKAGQRIDGNQEFVGQGLSNLAGAFFSAYPSSGSFNRSGLNFEAGARTPLAAVFSAVALVLVLLVVAPLAAWLPLAVMAGLLFVVAWGLIDRREMRRVIGASRGDAVVLVVTFVATLTLQLEFAIFVGVLASLLVYLNRTTHPNVTRIVPDPATRRFGPASAAAPPCPQLDILRIDGSLYFGAVEHVRDALEQARRERPDVRRMLLVGTGVNFIDVAGAELLAQVARDVRVAGGALYLCNLKAPVREVLERSGALAGIGAERVFETKGEALQAIYADLDPGRCASCGVRAFAECQATLPDGRPRLTARPDFDLT
ncbi:MAG TPA: SulP family inorganic anion transporter [Casimicrobiaceae bacterium]|nr:SulP family inorganic anion transporter [Casimicrobiaceae bacterium]